MNYKKIISFSFLLVFVFSLISGNVFAADFRLASENKGNVNVEKSEEIKNLYTAGNMVTIDANVLKGLHAAGNVVTINGDVGGTVYSGAGTLSINGNIGGSVHGGGGSVIINSKIADDLFVGGGNIVITKSALIGGDLYIGGGTVDIQGAVLGDVYLGGGMIIINSEISGDVKISSADKIVLGSNAKINGSLKYYSKNELITEVGALVLGETTILEKKFDDSDSSKGTMLAIIFMIISLSVLAKVGGLIVIGLILVYLFKNITETVVNESLTNFWKNLGIGLLLSIIIPIVIIILLVSVIGVWLGIIVAILYILSILLAVSLAGINFGSFVIGVIKKNKNYSLNWKIVVGGVISLLLVKLIPIIGGIISCIFILISIGAIYSLMYRLRK